MLIDKASSAMLLCCLFSCGQDTTPKRRLEIELHLPQAPIDTKKPVSVEIVFHNRGDTELKIPWMEKAKPKLALLFVDFLFVGSHGGRELVSNGSNWVDPTVKPVEMRVVRPSGSVRMKFSTWFPALNRVDSWQVMALYQDHSYGHANTYPEFRKKDSAVWSGIAVSNLIPVRFVE